MHFRDGFSDMITVPKEGWRGLVAEAEKTVYSDMLTTLVMDYVKLKHVRDALLAVHEKTIRGDDQRVRQAHLNLMMDVTGAMERIEKEARKVKDLLEHTVYAHQAELLHGIDPEAVKKLLNLKTAQAKTDASDGKKAD